MRRQMIGNINFSLYSSPTTAYGNVVGEIEVDELIQKGDDVAICVVEPDEWFLGKLKVQSVHPSSEPDRLLIELEDVVAPTKVDAAALARKLGGAGLFVDIYELPL